MQQSDNSVDKEESTDPVEAVVKHIHVVIPILGAMMIFVMAAIAVTVA